MKEFIRLRLRVKKGAISLKSEIAPLFLPSSLRRVAHESVTGGVKEGGLRPIVAPTIR